LRPRCDNGLPKIIWAKARQVFHTFSQTPA
jgi:hypothetical protein